ncbi:hypothetical protein C3K47_16215 [Solitalea longa]|uniref:Calx-beta domain-containing protein n=1 Tax=Solitalea longa TaxID=2079460 RepID=A0A2S4ZY92_9SPHI|nr:Calx-beta domain-containing protein [Solitalea longa]POY35328.1 hypothetical protein C3K47_16215 [Solitalea longa]
MKDSTNVLKNDQFKGLAHSFTKTFESIIGAIKNSSFSLAIKLFSLSLLLFLLSSADDYDGAQTVKPQKGLIIMSAQAAPPCVSVLSASCKEANSGYSTMDFKVNLDGPCKEEITVEYYTGNGTALVKEDYNATSGTITFAPGEVSKIVKVLFKGDYYDEENEQFFIYLKNAKNATICESKAAGTIIDDDPFPTLRGADMSVGEKNDGIVNLKFYFNFKTCSHKETRVDYYTYDGTATAGEDYQETKGTLIIPAEQTKFEIVVPVYGDTKVEPNETFFIKLLNPDGLILNDDVFQATILNDDKESAIPALSISNSTVSEADGTASFTVSLSSAAAQAVTVDYATADVTATAGSDYTAASGSLTFAPGETSKIIDVAITDDTEDESDETFNVNLSNVSATATISDGQGVGTIQDNDEPPVTPELTISSSTVGESEGTAVFNVNLNVASSETITVDYATADGSANSGSDFSATGSGTLTFAPGEISKTIIIDILNDTEEEGDEQYYVNLFNVTNATIINGQGLGTIVDDDQPVILPGVQISGGVFNEAVGSAEITIYLSQAGTESISVDFNTADGTATAPNDYTANSGTVTFAPGETSKVINVSIANDQIDEEDETFRVVLSNVVNADLLDADATFSILDDDGLPTVSVLNAQANEGDGTITVTIQLNGESSQDVSVDYATANSSAVAGQDYTATSGTVTFPAGSSNSTQTFTVAITDDNEDETNESFLVNLSNAVNADIANAQGEETIIDNDETPPAISISNVTVNEGNSGTVDAVFTVSLDKAATGSVTVDWATQDNTAASPADYVSGSGTLTFAVGETSKTLTVTVNGDETVENDESFLVNLTNATGGATIADAQGVGGITNDDETPPAFTIDDITVAEGNSGTVNAVFTVSLSKVAEGTTTVDWSTQDNGATSPSDYASGTGTLSFAAGETSKTITIVINGDETVEGNEAYLINLSNATGGATIGDPQGFGVITNDDETLPALTINNVSVTEGNSGTVNAEFTVTLDKVAGDIITVDWSTQDNGAISPSDYVSATGSLSFAAGETSKTVTVTINGDVTVEGDEGFLVNLSNVSSGATIADAQGIGTIENDDEAPPSFDIDDVSVAEGNSGTSTTILTVTLNKAATGTVTVDWSTQDNGALSPSDYVSGNGTLTFAAGETSKTITLTINGDVIVEGNEGFLVNLTNATGGAAIGDSQGSVTISNDDETLPALTIGNVELTEGNSGTSNAVLTVTMDKAAAGAITVDWSTQDNAAVSPTDFASGNGTLTFAAGETSKTITVVVNGDLTNEPDEILYVNLANISSGATISDGTGYVNILNDDEPLPVLSSQDIQVNEGNSGTVDAVFTVTLDKAGTTQITVDYQTVENSATDPEDFTAVTGTLTFAPGETSKTVTVKVIGDVDEEGTHGFYLQLLNPSSNATVGTAFVYCTITDDDLNIPAVRIYDTYVYEGNSGSNDVTFYVYLNKTSTETITVDFATEDVTAVAGEDYVAASGTLTFNPGETYKTFTVAVNGDVDFEANEQFKINLTNITNATTEDGVGNFIIYNDDNAVIAYVPDSYFNPEGDSGTTTKTFYVYLSNYASKVVTLDYELLDGSAKDGEDYVVQTGTLTFNLNEYYKGIDIVCNGDNDYEGNEFFILKISNIQNSLITDSEGIITIYDDDAPTELYVSDTYVNPEGNEGETQTATFTVFLTNYSDQVVTVDYATGNGTAVSGTDYESTSGTLTINPGEYYKQVTVNVNGDNALESNEIFQLQISNPTNATMRDAFGITTIYDDDNPPYFYVTSTSATEGNDETFYIYRSVLTGTATVNYATINQSAVAPGDYTAANGTMTFNAGEYFKPVTVTTISDGEDEPYEYFTMRLSMPSTGYVILDQDGYGEIQGQSGINYNYLATSGASVTEGDSGTQTLSVYISLNRAGNNNPVTVNYALQNITATGGSDYVASSGTLTFATDEYFKQIDITINGDNTFEPDETFRVLISSPTNAFIFEPSANVTITNDDTPALLWVGDNSVTETDAATGNTITIGVSLSPANSDQTVTVNYTTQNAGATSGNDYTATSGTLTFDPGETYKTIDINIIGDNAFEPIEYFRLLLSSPANAIIGDGDGYVQINDDDQTPYIYTTDPAITEGDSGDPILYFYVYLSNFTDKVVTVDYTTQDVTTTTDDYTPVNGTLTFDGINGQYVEVHVNPDLVFEPNEYVNLILSNPVNAVLADTEGTGLINDDDNTPIVSIYDTYVYEGNDGETDMYFGVWLNQYSDQTITVDFATTNGTAASPGDFTAQTGTLTFAPFETYKAVNIKIIGDVVDESDEAFKVTISNPTNVLIGDNEATGTIYDDDAGSGFAPTSGRISNVFTPNGDGVNDRFKIEGVENADNDLTVVNRYGSQVFKSVNYKNDWDGQGCSDGTYFYLLRTKDKDGKVVVKKGYITLVRNLNR